MPPNDLQLRRAAETVVPVNYVDPEGTNAAAATNIPGMCDAQYSFEECGGQALFWRSEPLGGGGGGGGGIGFGNNFAGVAVANPSILACLYNPACQIVVTAGGAIYVDWQSPSSVGRLQWGLARTLWNLIFAGADLRQNRAIARQVGNEQGCRPPEPDDFDKVHEIIKDQKGPDGKVSVDVLREAGREVLCK